MMLQSHELIPMTDAERRVWEQVIPVDHYLRRLATAVDFERFRPLLEASYAGDFGRPPLDVVMMLKLELLERHYNLSDRGVMDSSALNIACRWFLGLSLTSRCKRSLTSWLPKPVASGWSRIACV